MSKTSKKIRITPYALQVMCYVGQHKVYAEAEGELKMLKGIDISAKQIQNVCHHYGESLEVETKQMIESGGSPPPPNDGKKTMLCWMEEWY